MYIGDDPIEFHKCLKSDCERLVHVGTDYCCHGCRNCDELGCEINSTKILTEPDALAHSDGCNERWKHRRDIIKNTPRKPSYRNVVIPVFDMGKFIEGVERYRRSKGKS